MEVKKETNKKWKRIANVHEYGFFSQPDGTRKEFDRIHRYVQEFENKPTRNSNPRIHEYHRSGIDFCGGEYASHSVIEKVEIVPIV